MSAQESPTRSADRAPVVELRGVSKAYGPIQALQDVELDLFAG